MKRTLFGIAALALALAPAAQAADPRPPAAAARPALLTVDYVNAEVTDVIRALASQSRVNVAINPGVKGQVTVHLRDKTVDEAMSIVTNLAGLGMKKVSGTYVVAPRAEMRATLERLGDTRTVELTHLTGKAAADLAQGAFTDLTARPQGKAVVLVGASEDLEAAEKLVRQNDVLNSDSVRVTERVAVKNRPAAQVATALVKMVPNLSAEAAGESVVLTGTKTQVELARSNAEMLDVPPQADTDTRLYKIRYTSAPKLIALLERAVPDVQVFPGPDSFGPSRPQLNLLTGTFVGALSGNGSQQQQQARPQAQSDQPGAPGAVSKNALSLLLKGSPQALDQAIKVLEMTDTPPVQMMVEAKVVETSPELAEEYGLKWSWTRFGFYEAVKGTGVTTGTSGPGGEFTNFNTRPLGFGEFSRVPWSFQAVLSAMVTRRQAKLLASPQIAVLDDQDASIFIGDTLRFQSLAQSSPTTGNQFTVVEVPVGIILLVHPRVNGEGDITLRVKPVVSTVTAFTAGGLPQTSAREAETVVRVKDGDTLVIGGLIRDEDIRTMSKIPLLGDLPLLGHLFRHNQRNHRRSEVMVVLTIKIIK